ncbi:hypothetical protein ACQPZ8_18075 [Actinomadura nitritigenes]|uniref:hypothetical protein n=1 Tax=Actinomadura nitritigenes TaxID=134602 RepID=UPI003D89F0A3
MAWSSRSIAGRPGPAPTSRCGAAAATPRPGVDDPEQAADHFGDPLQRPSLVLDPAVRGGAAVQLGLQPRELRLVQPRTSVRALGPKRLGPALAPGLPPFHPQIRGDGGTDLVGGIDKSVPQPAVGEREAQARR